MNAPAHGPHGDRTPMQMPLVPTPRFRRTIGVALLFVGALVGGGLKAIGLPDGAAYSLAFLIVGVGATTLELRLDRAPLFGGALLLLGTCSGGGWMAMGLNERGLPKWAAIIAVILLVVGILAAMLKLWSMTYRPGKERQRLAQRRGWQYLPRADVPVPGPHSAARLAGVPEDTRTVPGRDVISATVNGYSVTMFDLARPAGRHEQVRSVWLVQVPMTLPYAVLATFRHPDHPDHPDSGTGDAAVARLLLTPPAHNAVVGLRRTVWIENAHLCALWDSGARVGVSADAVEQCIDRLTAFAAILPWQAVAPYTRSDPA